MFAHNNIMHHIITVGMHNIIEKQALKIQVALQNFSKGRGEIDNVV